MKTTTLLALGVTASIGLAQSAAAQTTVLLNEQFNYANLASLQAVWGSTAGLGLDPTGGNPGPSATHDGSASIHSWVGNSTLSITPSDAHPVILMADIYDSGAGNERDTVGLRTGANPLFEMGMYNNFNDPAGATSGEGVRVLAFAGNQNWHQLGPFTTGWSRWQATFTTYSLTVQVDTGIDGTWDLSWTSTGLNPTGAFTDLRFGGPSGLSSAGGGFAVDNILLEVTSVPEPCCVGLSLFGGFALAAGALSRRRSA